MATKNGTTNETQIRELIEERIRAIDEKDLDRLMSRQAADVLTFDVLEPLQYTGSGTIRQRAEKWLSSYQSRIGYEVRNLDITAGDDVAFCHYLYHVSGTLLDGGKVDMWVRATLGLQKDAGKWTIVHEHQSVPFDAQTGKASLDLKP